MLPKIEYYKSWILTTGLDTATANGKGPEATFYGRARKEIQDLFDSYWECKSNG